MKLIAKNQKGVINEVVIGLFYIFLVLIILSSPFGCDDGKAQEKNRYYILDYVLNLKKLKVKYLWPVEQ